MPRKKFLFSRVRWPFRCFNLDGAGVSDCSNATRSSQSLNYGDSTCSGGLRFVLSKSLERHTKASRWRPSLNKEKRKGRTV